jgi:DNA-directed RNA polymerase subunit RPC12/RpoP
MSIIKSQNTILICPNCRRKLPEQDNIKRRQCPSCGNFIVPMPIEENAWKILQEKIEKKT